MPDYLLDTTEVIDYARGLNETVKLLRTLFDEGSTLGCCDIVVAEVHAGVRARDRAKVDELLDALRFYSADRSLAKKAGEYIDEYGRKGVTLAVADALIAAVAIGHRLTLVTKNQRHYPMPELMLYVQPGTQR